MSQSAPNDDPRPTFDPSAAHQARPKARALRGFPLQAQGPEGKPIQMIGLADARQISDKMVATIPAAQTILRVMDGTRTIDQIVADVGRGLTREFLEGFVAQLDGAGLIEGPTFDAMREKMRADFDSATHLPPASSAAFADALVNQRHGDDATDELRRERGAEYLRETMDQWMAKALENADKPSFDALPRAIVAPHIDYTRGWVNYAHVWGRLRVADRPDRVIILGTNHFGEGTGVTACDKGFETPLGVCDLDQEALNALQSRLGPEQAELLVRNRFDHEREHSIELQIPWIQHCLGPDDAGGHCKVLGVLVHDPAINNGESYDGNGLGIDPFVSALKSVIQELPGRTLLVASADLSHAGPAFGDQQALAGDSAEAAQARNRVVAHDRELLGLLVDRKPTEMVSSLAWQQNPTRWCSIGNLTATFLATEPEQVELLNYAAAMDPQGMSLVSTCAMALS
ncbi:MAG: AmmeMemoRadiSam system protein B [Phycisphaeraceae bacterium]|nr:AmmeMemoRadiSam system protein B [Phycisphaeraceae bacterium]